MTTRYKWRCPVRGCDYECNDPPGYMRSGCGCGHGAELVLISEHGRDLYAIERDRLEEEADRRREEEKQPYRLAGEVVHVEEAI